MQIKLPKLLLLNGPRPRCFDFAKKFVDHQPNDTAYQDLSAPVILSIIDLFYDSNALAIDLDDPVEWFRYFTYGPIPFEDCVRKQREQLRQDYGRDILGRIFVRTYEEHDWADLFPCIVVRDFDDHADAKPLLDHFGPHSIIAVYLNYTTQFPKSTGILHNIWIPHDNVDAQLAFCLKELQTLSQLSTA